MMVVLSIYWCKIQEQALPRLRRQLDQDFQGRFRLLVAEIRLITKNVINT